MESLLIQISEWFKQLSYLGVVLALSIEFIPAELVLPLVGYWVYQGDMNFYLVVLAGTFGGTLGPLTLYAIGRLVVDQYLIKYGKYVFIKENTPEQADLFFDRYGAGVAFFARFIPGVRTTISTTVWDD